MWSLSKGVTEPRPGGSVTTSGAGSTLVVALLRNLRKTECGAGLFLIRFAVRAAPFALLRNLRKTECGAGQFLIRFAVRAAPFALLRNLRKTECGAGQFLIRFAVRAAPFALPACRGSACFPFLCRALLVCQLCMSKMVAVKT